MNETNMNAIADLIVSYAPIHAHYTHYANLPAEIRTWRGLDNVEQYLKNFEEFEKIYQSCLMEKNPIYQLVLCKCVTNFIKTNNNEDKDGITLNYSSQTVLKTFTSLNHNMDIANKYIKHLMMNIAQCALSQPILEKIYLEQTIGKTNPQNANEAVNKI